FGTVTAIRWQTGGDTGQVARAVQQGVQKNLKPANIGLTMEPLRERALAAVAQGQDFGELFLGLSFFLIAAALILVAMLFQFGIEQRMSEVGLLLALGFLPKQVRRLFMREGIALSIVGAVAGTGLAVLYAQLMLRALS